MRVEACPRLGERDRAGRSLEQPHANAPYAVIDASGTWNKLTQEVAVARMVQAGVIPMTWVAIAAELQGDWRKPTADGMAKLMGSHLHFYGNLISSFIAAKG